MLFEQKEACSENVLNIEIMGHGYPFSHINEITFK